MIQEKYYITDEYKTISKEILVENLPSLRARVGLTQEEVAHMLSVSRQTYYSWENKKSEMPWSAFLAIVYIFDSFTSTHEMIRELRIYPIDLFKKFNGELEIDGV